MTNFQRTSSELSRNCVIGTESFCEGANRCMYMYVIIYDTVYVYIQYIDIHVYI